MYRGMHYYFIAMKLGRHCKLYNTACSNLIYVAFLMIFQTATGADDTVGKSWEFIL